MKLYICKVVKIFEALMYVENKEEAERELRMVEKYETEREMLAGIRGLVGVSGPKYIIECREARRHEA